MRRLRQQARCDDGFTMVEVLVAMVIILIGVLGTLVLVDRANTASQESRTRQTANNILRDMLDAAQGVPYSSLTPSGLAPALQTRGFADAVPATSGTWDIIRNGTTFTVTSSVCIVDDPHDGSQNSHPSSSNFCSDSPAGSGDSNGDDYRRVTFSINPPTTFGAGVTGTTVVGQSRTTNIGGSGSGGGSSASIDITQMKIDTSAGKTTLYSGQVARCPGSFLSCPGGAYGNGPTATTVSPKQVYFVATTASTAQKMKFSVDGKVLGTVNGPATTFNWTWTLPDNQPDGTYTVSAQVFDSSGNTAMSDPVPVTTILNRYLPDPNAYTPASAGRNHLYLQGTSGFGYPEIETFPNNQGARVDRDIVGFQTVRFVGSATGVNACGTNSILIRSCQDTGAPVRSSSTTLKYRITPYALNADGTQQMGNGNPPTSADVNLANTRPCAPRNLTVSRNGMVVTLSWQAPALASPCTTASGDPDASDCIDFYRVYTDPAGSSAFSFGDRSDRSPFGVPVSPCGASSAEQSTSITLWESDSTLKSYQLTAVDTKLDESVPIIPTNCGTSC